MIRSGERDMRHAGARHGREYLVAALLALAPGALAAAQPADRPKDAVVAQLPTLDAAMAEYQRKLAEYTRARQEYEQRAEAYWGAIREKRQARNAKRRAQQQILADDYVLVQPPVYTGPPKPID